MGGKIEEFLLGERCSVKSSKRIFAREYVEDGIPFFRSKDVIDKSLGSFTNYDLYISEKRYCEIKAKFGSPQKGDLLISSVGNRSGQPYVVQDEGDFYFKDGNILWLSEFENIDADFLAYWLKSQLGQYALDAVMIGSAQKALTIDAIRKLRVEFPCFKLQIEAAKLLKPLDDKIELNRQMNATLEAMAQALFKSWFVDFDPVIDNALAAGNPIPDELQARAGLRATLGDKRKPLPEAIQKQFPSSFVFSEEMGWIPEGWEVALLEDIALEIRRGISPKYVEEGGIRVVNQKCIRDHSINYALTRRNDQTKKKIDGRELVIGDVLVNSTGVGTLGRIAQVLTLEETTVVDSHVTVVRTNAEKYKPYTFARMMLTMEPRIEAMGEGSTGQTELNRANLQAILVLVPSLGCQEWVEKKFFDDAQKIVSNSVESETLTRLRDALLPKLLSGQLRIPDAEKFVAEVV